MPARKRRTTELERLGVSLEPEASRRRTRSRAAAVPLGSGPIEDAHGPETGRPQTEERLESPIEHAKKPSSSVAVAEDDFLSAGAIDAVLVSLRSFFTTDAEHAVSTAQDEQPNLTLSLWRTRLETVRAELEGLAQACTRADSSQRFGEALAQALWCLYLSVTLEKPKELGTSVASWPPWQRQCWQELLRLVSSQEWLTPATLGRWLPAEAWLQTELVPALNDREHWTRFLRRLHTRVNYTQPVYNAFCEQPHGFASLLCALTAWMESAGTRGAVEGTLVDMAPEEALNTIADEHLSVFQLETNRVIDLEIQLLIAAHEWKLRCRRDAAQQSIQPAVESAARNKTLSVDEDRLLARPSESKAISSVSDVHLEQYLIACLHRAPGRAVAQLLGFRLQQMQTASACAAYQRATSPERLPEAVFLTAARLIHENVVSLEQLWPHLLEGNVWMQGTSRVSLSPQQSASTTLGVSRVLETPRTNPAEAVGVRDELRTAAAYWDDLAVAIRSQTKELLRVRLVDRDSSSEKNGSKSSGSRTEVPSAAISTETDTAMKAIDTLYESLGVHGLLAPLAGQLALLAALIDHDEFSLVQRWIQREWLSDLDLNSAASKCRQELIYSAAPLRYALFAYVLRHGRLANEDQAQVSAAATRGNGAGPCGPDRTMDLSAHSTSALLQACRYLGGHMAQRPELLVSIWSMVNKSVIRSKGDAEISLPAGKCPDTGCTWLVTESLIPAVLCSQGSVGISRWIFEHPDSPLRHLSYSQRYALYLHPHCHGQRSFPTDDTTDSVLIPFWQALYRSMGKRLLRRLAGDTVGMIAKSLEPVLNSGPWSVSRIIMEQIQSYDNLVVPVADMLVWPLRAAEQTTKAYPSEMIYATAFSLDVFFAVALDELAGPQTNRRPRLRRDGTGIAAWFLNTIELVVQLSVRLAQRLETHRAAASSIDTSRADSAPWDALHRVLEDWWRALLHLACERMIQGDYAFYALAQRALECMGAIQPWDDEMMSDAQLETLAKDQLQLANARSSKSGPWNLLERASGSDAGRHDNLKVWSLLVAIDSARQRLVADPHHADLSLKALAALIDALQATFLQLARFLGIQWTLREASERGTGESSVSTTAVDEMIKSLSTACYLYLFRIRNRIQPSRWHRDAPGLDSLERSISALLTDEDSHRRARLNKAGVSTLSELVSVDWLYLFWSTDQPPDRASPQWFGSDARHQVNVDEQDERVQLVAEFLLERCFLPRVLAAPAEYRCVVAWVLLLAQEPNIAPFNLLLLLTILFKTAFLLVQGMTRLECIRLARFVREMLRLVDRWRRQGPDSWERQHLSNAAFQGRGGAPCQWSQFVLWHELMREKMLNVACDALEMLPRPLAEQPTLSSGRASHQVTPDLDRDADHERNPESVSSESAHLSLGNILRALNIMVEEFPSRSNTAGERIEKALSSIIEREQNVSDDHEQHTDILTLATSYLGRLRARRLGLEARGAFQRTSGGPRPEAKAFSSRTKGSSAKPVHHRRADTDTSPERRETRIGEHRSSMSAGTANVSSNPRRSDERPGREDHSLLHRERSHRPIPGSWARTQRHATAPERRPNFVFTGNEPPKTRGLNPQITGSNELRTGPLSSSERDANGKLVKPDQERRRNQGMRHGSSRASTGRSAQPRRSTGAARDEREQQPRS